MPFGSVTLIPGVDVTKTPTLLQASISESQLVRFRDGLVQKYGGWERLYAFNVAGITRDLHAWQDLNDVQHLLIGSTTNVIHRVAAKQPFVLPGYDTILAAADTTIITGGTEPTLTDIDSVVLGNYSGTTANFLFAVIN